VDHMCGAIFVKQGFRLVTITASKQLYYQHTSATRVRNSIENLIICYLCFCITEFSFFVLYSSPALYRPIIKGYVKGKI
jgi:hypothetical protein